MHQSLDIENIARLPLHLRILAQRAADGAVGGLSDFLGLVSKFPEHYALALPVVFIHLDNSKIPSPAEMDSLALNPERLPHLIPVIAAEVCVQGISRMILNRIVSEGSYADLWSRLYRWIMFLDIYWQHIPPQLRVFGPKYTSVASSTIILTFGNHPDTSEVVHRSPGVRGILVKYWSALVDNHGTVVHEGTVTHPDGWPNIYSILIFLAADEPASILEEMSDGVTCSSARHLKRLIVNQMNDATTHYDSRPDIAVTVLSALLLLITGKCAQSVHLNLKEILLSDGVVPALVNAVRVLADYIPRTGGSINKGPILGVAFGLLVSRFQSDSGHRWLAQALDAGLLNIIITLGLNTEAISKVDSCNIFPLLKQLLHQELPGYLAYYTVALRMKMHFPSARFMAASTAFRKSALADSWTQFSDLVEENLGALDFFESKTRRSAKACESMECLRITEKSRVQSCSGCRLAHYCSTECQKSDWDVGHKHWCRKLASIDFPGPSSPRDRAFLRAVMQHNLHSAIADIMIRQQWPRVD
ncbi:hypothetical protein DFH06DRAFT_110798 [Mycena polygramma]|nr:hypothetical protein DFH06DRAFT_110798 [Mycena polygramma]